MNKQYRVYLRFMSSGKKVYHLGRSIPIREIHRLGVKNYSDMEDHAFGKDKSLLITTQGGKRLSFVYHFWHKFIGDKK